MKHDPWLSILGMFKYNPDVFQDLVLPKASELDLTLPYMQDTVEDLNVSVLQFKILMDLAELPLVYTDPDLLRTMIGMWSSARTPIWRELWKTTLYKYVPIWNKDGVIEETRTLETTGTSSGTLEDKSASGHTVNVTTSKHTVTDQDTTDSASGDDRRTSVIDEDTTGSSQTDLDRSTVTDQDTSDTKTTDVTEQTVTDEDTTDSKSGSLTGQVVTDEDTTASKSGQTSEHTVTDQDTTESGTSSGSGTLNRTLAHNVTGYDVDSYAPDTQDVTTESTSTSGQTSGTGTNDMDVTASGTSSESGTGTKDVTEDRTESTSESGTGTRDVTEDKTGTTRETGAGTNDVTETVDETSTTTQTGTRDVTQTDTGTWKEDREGTNDVDVTETGSSLETMSGTGSLDRSTAGETAGTEEESIRRVEQGNIGITTTQQMIKEQRESVMFDMYQLITDEFKKTFCIMVY